MRPTGVWFLVLLMASLMGCNRPSPYLYANDAPKKDGDPAANGHQEIQQHLRSVDTGGTGNVDFIWVVGGMTERQNAFFQGGTDFMTAFSAKTYLSWRMAVLGSDPSAAPQLGMNPLFTNTDPNPIAVFSQAISQVLTTLDGENIFDPVIGFLTDNPTFVRPDSNLAIILSNDAPGFSSLSGDQFLSALAGYKSLSNVLIYGVFAASDLGCNIWDMDTPWNFHGSDFEKVIQATGGQSYSLCGPSFGSSLSQIADNLTQQWWDQLKIKLNNRPIVTSIVVKYHDQVLPPGPQSAGGVWYYDFNDNAIGFYDRGFMNGTNDLVDINYDEIQ